jgi:(p)ppGpp synthase/HD superfamily hydrolase
MNLKGQEQLLLAIRVATRAHAGQKRKDGTDYIAHPLRVMARAVGANAGLAVMIACVLHDVVEDTSLTLEDLRDLGFDPIVVATVDYVTRRKGESYKDFIKRCKQHDLARQVKIFDIDDNLEDQSALEPEEAAFLKTRYTEALQELYV